MTKTLTLLAAGLREASRGANAPRLVYSVCAPALDHELGAGRDLAGFDADKVDARAQTPKVERH